MEQLDLKKEPKSELITGNCHEVLSCIGDSITADLILFLSVQHEEFIPASTPAAKKKKIDDQEVKAVELEDEERNSIAVSV